MKYNHEKPGFVYLHIAGVIQQQIANGILRTGDILSSLHTFCRE